MSSKQNNDGSSLADFCPYRYEVSEGSHFPTKNHKINPFAVGSRLESNCKLFRQSAIGENVNLKHETQLKKIQSNNRGNYTHQYNEKREAVTSFLHLCLNHIWAPGQRHVCISKQESFFLVFTGQKHMWGTRRATNEQVHWQAPLTFWKAHIIQYTK